MISIIIINSSPNSFLTVILFEMQIKYVYRLFEKAWSARFPDVSSITLRGANHPNSQKFPNPVVKEI